MTSTGPSAKVRVVETGRDVRFVLGTWTPTHLKFIKQHLTIRPFRVKGYGSAQMAPPQTAYRQTQWELIVPRAWALACMNKGVIEAPKTMPPSTPPLRLPDKPCISIRSKDLEQMAPWTSVGTFAFTLQPFQVEITNQAWSHLEGPCHSVLLHIGCGQGKTIMALYLASRLRVKTLILVQDSFLLEQWMERIHSCLPDVSCGKLQQDVNDLDTCDIVIGMVQTVVSRYAQRASVFSKVGCLILDECHRMASPLFSQTIQLCMAPFLIGCSATPERQDGLHHLLEWYMGPSVQSSSRPEAPVHILQFRFPTSGYVSMQTNEQGVPNVVQMLNDIARCEARNEALLAWIKVLLTDPRRVIIVLSHRRNQLEWFFERLSVEYQGSTGFYVGGMNMKDLNDTATRCRVILATYQMAQQALDIPRLNTLVMGTPMKDMRQSIGRITRLSSGSACRAWVVDTIDSGLSTCQNHATQRRRLYRQREYSQQTFHQVPVLLEGIVDTFEEDDDGEEEEEEEESKNDQPSFLCDS